MKKLLFVLALICVLPLASAVKPEPFKRTHVWIHAIQDQVDALATVVGGFIDQSANISTLKADVEVLKTKNAEQDARIKTLQNEFEHPNLTISKLEITPPSKFQMFVSDLEPPLSGEIRLFKPALYTASYALSLDFTKDIVTGVRYFTVGLNDGEGTTQKVTIPIGEFTAALVYLDTTMTRAEAETQGTEFFWFEGAI